MNAEPMLLSCAEDIKIWNPTDLKCSFEIKPHSGPISDASWSNDSNYIGSTSQKGDKIIVSQLKNSSGKCLSCVILGENEFQTCLDISNVSSRYLASGGKCKNVTVWDLNTKKKRHILKGHSDDVCHVKFYWNDSHLVSASKSGEILIHSLTTTEKTASFKVPNSKVINGLRFSYTKSSLLGAVTDFGDCHLWDTYKGALVHSFNNVHFAPSTCLAFSPVNDMLMLVSGLDKTVVLLDALGKKYIKKIAFDEPLSVVDFYQDGSTFAVGSTQGKITIYDLRKGSAPLKSFQSQSTEIKRLLFYNNLFYSKKQSIDIKCVRVESSSVSDTDICNGSNLSTPIDFRHWKLTDDVFTPEGATQHSTPGSITDADIFSPLPAMNTLSYYNNSAVQTTDAHVSKKSGLSVDHSGTFSAKTSPLIRQIILRASTEGIFSPLRENDESAVVEEERKCPDGESKPSSIDALTHSNLVSRIPTAAKSSRILSSASVSEVSQASNNIEPVQIESGDDDSKKIEGYENAVKLDPESASTINTRTSITSTSACSNCAKAILELKDYVRDSMSEVEEQIHNDIKNLHFDMINQFHNQLMEVNDVLKQMFMNEDIL